MKEKGIAAAAFQADAGKSGAVRATIPSALAAFGPVSALFWIAIASTDVENFLSIDPAAVLGMFDSAVMGLLSALQEALPDLKSGKDPEILFTNGISGELNAIIDSFGAHRNVMGFALANAMKSKLLGLLAR